MKKEKKSTKQNKEKKSSAKSFFKKRAPIYLAIIAMLIVFVVPELTKGTLDGHIPNDLIGEEKEALDMFLAYNGPNNSGLNAIDVLSEKIEDDYPNEKIYDHKDTVVKFTVSALDVRTPSGEYQISLDFQTKKEGTLYDWYVNIQTGEISGMNTAAQKILKIVDYSN